MSMRRGTDCNLNFDPDMTLNISADVGLSYNNIQRFLAQVHCLHYIDLDFVNMTGQVQLIDSDRLEFGK